VPAGRCFSRERRENYRHAQSHTVRTFCLAATLVLSTCSVGQGRQVSDETHCSQRVLAKSGCCTSTRTPSAHSAAFGPVSSTRCLPAATTCATVLNNIYNTRPGASEPNVEQAFLESAAVPPCSNQNRPPTHRRLLGSHRDALLRSLWLSSGCGGCVG